MTTWKLVPVEPTEAMIKAVNAADSHSFELSWSEGYKAMLNAAPAPDVQPVAWVDLLKEADQIVKNKPTWKSFIDGTPLSNDIAVWMADFAQKYATPALDVEPAIYPEEARQMGLEEVPYYTHPPASDVRELVEALQAICGDDIRRVSVELHEKARAALAKWEGK